MAARRITKGGYETSPRGGQIRNHTDALFACPICLTRGADLISVISCDTCLVPGPRRWPPTSVIPIPQPAALPRGSRCGPSRFIVTRGIEAKERVCSYRLIPCLELPGNTIRTQQTQHHREIWQPRDHCFAIHLYACRTLGPTIDVARGPHDTNYHDCPAAPFNIFSICS